MFLERPRERAIFLFFWRVVSFLGAFAYLALLWRLPWILLLQLERYLPVYGSISSEASAQLLSRSSKITAGSGLEFSCASKGEAGGEGLASVSG